MKVSKIVFDAVAVEVPENAHGRLFIDKKKAAKVGVKLLDAGARGNEIVIGAQVMELHFDEGFLQTEMIVEAVGPAARIRSDDAKLADFQIVETELGSDSNAPVDGLEAGVAVKQVQGETKRLIEEGLLPFAEKPGTAWTRAAHIAGRRNPAAIEKSFG